MMNALSIQPGREEFGRLAATAPWVPLTAEFIADTETPVGAFQKLLDEDASLGGDGGASFLLESAEQAEGIGRYSFMGIRPLATWELRDREIRVIRAGQREPERIEIPPGGDPLAFLEGEMARCQPARIPALAGVPFVGGAVGWLGYEMARWFEPTLPPPPPDALGLPDAIFLLTDVLLVFDHRHRRLRIMVHARTGPGTDATTAYDEATARLRRLARRLESPYRLRAVRPWPRLGGDLPVAASNTTREEYEAMVRTCQEHIRAGDIFQCVPSQRFTTLFAGTPLALYRALRLVNPSPYMFLLRFAMGGPAFVGSSPEVHVRALGGRVEIRPIAGTRRRGATPEEDAALAAELLADPKERAEHLMLVDLARNDAGRVSKFGTVRVTDFLRVERYSHVMHLVSDVTGELPAGTSAAAVLRATFPAGTVTGAPKVRAMEIISSLEKSKRGFYAGAVCYLGHDGSLDSCIALRSVVLQDGQAHVQAGAGVVADSVPASEHQETVNKAAAVLRAVELAREMEE